MTFLTLLCSVKTFYCSSRVTCAGFSCRFNILQFSGHQGYMNVAKFGVNFPSIFVLGEVCFYSFGYAVPNVFGEYLFGNYVQIEDVFIAFPRTLCWVSFGLNILLFVGYRGDMKIFTVLFATSRVVLVSSRNSDGLLCSRSFVI